MLQLQTPSKARAKTAPTLAPDLAAKDGEAQGTPRLVQGKASFAAQTLRQPAMARVSHLDPTDVVLSSAWRKLGGATHEGRGLSGRFGSCHRVLDLRKVGSVKSNLLDSTIDSIQRNN